MKDFAQLFANYRWPLVFILFLILMDAGLSVLFPLFIGFAVDDALIHQYQGAMLLGFLGLVTLMLGAGRRLMDSRVYAKVYEELGFKIGTRSETPMSTKSAHLGFLSELVEFFELSVPEILNALISLIGTLLLIFTINQSVFWGCLITLIMVAMIYGFTQRHTLRYHAAYNEEMENRVAALSEDSPIALHWHLRKAMKWNVKLSDLETLNFSVSWLFLISFLVLSIIGVAGEPHLSHGTLFALVLYLFQFIEQVVTLPMFYQQGLRLSEILKRLRGEYEVPENTVNHG